MTLLYSAQKFLLATSIILGCSLIGGSFCPADLDAGTGNLDRPGGVVAVTSGDSSYALVALPQLKHLRVFDLLNRVFVPAPNVYFPLSIPVGSFTHRIDVDVAHQLAYALDSADGAVYAITLGEPQESTALVAFSDAIPVGVSPSGLAADTAADQATLWVSSGISGDIVELVVDSDSGQFNLTRVVTVGEQTSDIAFDPEHRILVVGDAINQDLTLLNVEDESRHSVDIGGPSSRVKFFRAFLSTAAADEAIVVALRHDEPELAILRPQLASPLVGIVQLPDIAVDVANLNARIHGSEICVLVGQDTDCDYLAVGTLSGDIVYVDLTQTDATGILRPQIFDNNSEAATVLGDPNLDSHLYNPNNEDENALLRRPFVETELISEFGQPPHMKQYGDASYAFTYQGILPKLRSRHGRYDGNEDRFLDSVASAQLLALGAKVGDTLEVPEQTGCVTRVRVAIVEIERNALKLSGFESHRDCLAQAAGVDYNVRAGGEFTVAYEVESEARVLLDRVAFGESYDAEVITITLREATDSGGLPRGAPDTGAVLVVSVEDNFDPATLHLGDSGALMSGISSGLAKVGDAKYWRMVVSATGGSALFVIEPGAQGYYGVEQLPVDSYD